MNNIMPKKALIAVLCVIAVLGIFVLLAIASGDADAISEVDAKNAALEHAGVSEKDTDYIKVEQETEDGKFRYEVEFSAGGYEYDYHVDGRTGAVLKNEKELIKKNVPEDQNDNLTSAIDEATAKKAALDHAGVSEKDAVFSKAAIDDDGQYYEVDFSAGGKRYEYEIDIVRGTVIKSEVEDIQTN